jgi:IS30 family transposase
LGVSSATEGVPFCHRREVADWSPEQISKWLKVHYSNDESMRVSHETIYRSLFIEARGVLKKELREVLQG